MESLARANGNISKQQSFGDHSLKFEIPAGLHLAALAGVEPLAFVSGRAGQGLRRLLEAIHFGLRNQHRVCPIESAENLAAIANEEKPFIFVACPFEWTIFFQFVRARRLEAAVVPGEPRRAAYRRGQESRSE